MRALCFTLALLAVLPLAAADKPPSWLTEMATREVPAYESSVDFVVLFDEESVTVDPAGVVVTRARKAVKVINRSGRRAAVANVLYRRDTGKVRSLDAWLIYPSGKHKTYGKKETVDVALAANDVYNESRLKSISGTADADPGAVFGFESVEEDRSVFTQFLFQFQGAEPSLTARFSVELPAGWEAEGRMFNHEPVEPLVQGNRRTWELRNLEPIKDEPARPDIDAIAARLAVSYYPPDGAPGLGPAFRDWPAVSLWLDGLNEPQYKPDETVSAKAGALTGSAASALDKIAALAAFAQDVKYVSIQTGVGRGGGYRPHAAPEVLRNNYGDCKDKANLLRSMLDSIGVKAYPVAIYSSDRSFVREEWASPQQFNHAILAISVPDGTDLPAAKDYDGFGRLLFFDPTDPYTPFGWMPEDEQDAWALLVAPQGGGLLRTPYTAPAQNLLERTVEASLTEDGALRASLREECSGDSATRNRAYHKELSTPDYRKLIERWVSRGAPAAAVSKLDVSDDGSGFELDVDFEAPSYAQSMGGRLLVFKPALVERRDSHRLVDEERKYPVVLGANSYRETVKVALPAGFRVDEKPQDLDVDAEFGRYQASWQVDGSTLVFSRSMETRSTVIPVEQYGAVRDFYKAVTHAEQSPVVLVKE
ncbi:MAG: DUF3857 domain-containing protein [Acidobacteria bacterium]|nr:DUF3857 domain-containing protein [Acidobacteriota bacterium]